MGRSPLEKASLQNTYHTTVKIKNPETNIPFVQRCQYHTPFRSHVPLSSMQHLFQTQYQTQLQGLCDRVLSLDVQQLHFPKVHFPFQEQTRKDSNMDAIMPGKYLLNLSQPKSGLVSSEITNSLKQFAVI